MPEAMRDISTEFEFQKDCQDQKQLFLVDNLFVYLYNYQEDTVLMILSFENDFGFTLTKSPEIFEMNTD
jgi:hypothetical protein